MKRSLFWLLSNLVLALSVQAEVIRVSDTQDQRPGYLGDLRSEDREPARDLELLPSLPPRPGRLTLDRIFDRELTREFTQRYRDNFGESESERTFNNQPIKGSFWSYIENRDSQSKQIQTKQQVFGEYLTRRLIEYHMDRQFRDDPDLKDVWEFKEKVRQVEMTLAGGVKVKAIYNYSGNDLTTYFDSDVLNARVGILMDPRQFGPAEVKEYLVVLSRGFPRFNGEVFYRVRNGRAGFSLNAPLAPAVGTSLTFATDWDGQEDPIENYVHAGLVFNY